MDINSIYYVYLTILILIQKSVIAFPFKNISTKYCDSLSCNKSVNYLQSSMLTTANKCENFYQFACGGYIQKVKLRDSESLVDALTTTQSDVQKLLKILLNTKNFKNNEEPKAFKKMRNFYDNCLAESETTNANFQYNRILNSFGGWPVLVGASWNESKFSWNTTMLQLSGVGLSHDFFISYKVSINVRNNTKKYISIDQASFGLSREYLNKDLSDEKIQAYFNYMKDVAILLGANRDLAENDLRESLIFEKKLVNISQDESEQLDLMIAYSLESIQELESKYPFMQWLKYTKNIFSPYANINETEKVVVLAPKYLSKLKNLLDGTSNRVLANYAFWRLTQSMAEFLNQDIQNAKSKFISVLEGSKSSNSREDICYNQVVNYFPLALGSLYVRNHADISIIVNVIEMIENLRQTFATIIDENTWMSRATKRNAKSKINSMIRAVAYPNELLDDTKIDDYYKDLKILKNNYFQNILNIKYFQEIIARKNLRKPVIKVHWTEDFGDASRTEAYYDALANAIVIHFGIIQKFYYDINRPMYFNYARLGSIIAHELTHGFDNLGQLFDENGNKYDWWDEGSKEQYNQKVKCIVSQYSNYTAGEDGNYHIDGERTKDENIADIGGLKITYRAYNIWRQNNGPEQRLRGFEHYSDEQMFWIASATSVCQKIRPEKLADVIMFDYHVPLEFRAIGTISSSMDFAKDFNCPVGSPMNPEKKCSVW